jgi:hypothetical protein
VSEADDQVGEQAGPAELGPLSRLDIYSTGGRGQLASRRNSAASGRVDRRPAGLTTITIHSVLPRPAPHFFPLEIGSLPAS